MHIHPILRNHKALKAARQTGSKSSKARSQHLLISEMISYKHQEHFLP